MVLATVLEIDLTGQVDDQLVMVHRSEENLLVPVCGYCLITSKKRNHEITRKNTKKNLAADKTLSMISFIPCIPVDHYWVSTRGW
jgi:hypothetical protein